MLIGIISLTIISQGTQHSQENQSTTFNPKKQYSAEQLKEDFLLFRKALEEGHAGLDRYTSKKELDDHFEAIGGELNRSMTEYEFYLMLAPLIAHIHDGHTRVSLSAALDDYLSDQPILFPFNLRILDKRAYLFRNYSDETEIPMGSELLSINSHPLSVIIQQMLPFIPNDAHIQTSRYRSLERTVLFGGLFNLVFGPSTTYEITFREREAKKTKNIKTAGIKAKDLTSILDARYPEAATEKPPI